MQNTRDCKAAGKFMLYSVLSAITGSFLAAIFEGNNPATSVKTTLITTNTNATPGSRMAAPEIVVSNSIIRFIGIRRSRLRPIPIRPAQRPTIKVSDS